MVAKQAAWRRENAEHMRAYDRKRYPGRDRTAKNEALRALRATDEGRRRLLDQRLRQEYGITLEQYEAMIDAQDGQCVICRREPSGANHSELRLHVDHDHQCCPGTRSCGKCVRGLLCRACNVGLGHFGDDVEILLAALGYVIAAQGGAIRPEPTYLPL